MATLPAANYLSNAARTEAEMQTALDALRDVVAEIGSTAPTTRTISSGAMPVPTSSMALVQSEGYASGADDALATITTTGIDQGRIVILRNANTASSEAASSEKITISHGTSAGQIEMADNASFILCAERLIGLVYSGDHWVELWRNYGRKSSEDLLANRTDLGLGTASVETIATAVGASANSTVLKVGASANLVEDSILAMDASGNIKIGTVTGGNADTLDTYDSADFVRKADTATQSLAANVTSTTAGGTRFTVNTTGASQIPGFSMEDSGTERGALYYDSADGSVDLISKNVGGSITPRIRLNPITDRLEFAATGGAFQSLRPGAGNELDADTVRGEHPVASITIGAASVGGSFKFSDGTKTLLVQWPGTWTSETIYTGLAGYRWIYPTAYASVPFVLGGGLYNFSGDEAGRSWGVDDPADPQDRTVTTSQLEYQYTWSLVGIPIVIGEV
jgi:hypothetical protein